MFKKFNFLVQVPAVGENSAEASMVADDTEQDGKVTNSQLNSPCYVQL